MDTGKNDCKTMYILDCQNYYDFGAQMVSLMILAVIFRRVAKTWLNLMKDYQYLGQNEESKSVKRRIALNAVQIAYLIIFGLSILYAITLFFVFKNDFWSLNNSKLLNFFRVIEIAYINTLNSLNLTVGFLYWKAARAYYLIAEIELPFGFHERVKMLFFASYWSFGGAVIISCIWVLTESFDQKVNFQVTLFTTILSVVICISCRSHYRRRILSRIELNEGAIKIEVISSICIFVTSFLRIALYVTNIADKEWPFKVRQYSDSRRCEDQGFKFAGLLLFIQLSINLLPPAIYSFLFVSSGTKVRSRNTSGDDLIDHQNEQ